MIEISEDKPLYYFASVRCKSVSQPIYAQRNGEKIVIEWKFKYPTYDGGGIRAECNVVEFDHKWRQMIKVLSMLTSFFDKSSGGNGTVEIIEKDMRQLTFKQQMEWMMQCGEFNMYTPTTKDKSEMESEFIKIKKSEKHDGEKSLSDEEKKRYLSMIKDDKNGN